MRSTTAHTPGRRINPISSKLLLLTSFGSQGKPVTSSKKQVPRHRTAPNGSCGFIQRWVGFQLLQRSERFEFCVICFPSTCSNARARVDASFLAVIPQAIQYFSDHVEAEPSRGHGRSLVGRDVFVTLLTWSSLVAALYTNLVQYLCADAQPSRRYQHRFQRGIRVSTDPFDKTLVPLPPFDSVKIRQPNDALKFPRCRSPWAPMKTCSVPTLATCTHHTQIHDTRQLLRTSRSSHPVHRSRAQLRLQRKGPFPQAPATPSFWPLHL